MNNKYERDIFIKDLIWYCGSSRIIKEVAWKERRVYSLTTETTLKWHILT